MAGGVNVVGASIKHTDRERETGILCIIDLVHSSRTELGACSRPLGVYES